MYTNQGPQTLLMQVFDFTPDDLAANRSLTLSQRQIQMIQTMTKLGTSCMGSTMAIISIPFILITSFLVMVASSVQMALVVLVVLTGICLVGIKYYARAPKVLTAVYNNPTIRSIKGIAHLRTKNDRRANPHDMGFLILNDHPFPVKHHQFRQLQEGQVYQVYYLVTPGYPQILSIELMNDEDQISW